MKKFDSSLVINFNENDAPLDLSGFLFRIIFLKKYNDGKMCDIVYNREIYAHTKKEAINILKKNIPFQIKVISCSI